MGRLRTLVVGAGPAGMSVAVHLALTDPDAVRRDEFAVIDPAGRWLATWDAQMAAQRIEHLRSPVVHHPHPSPFALVRSVDQDRDLRRSDGLHVPTTTAFARFCTDVLEECRLTNAVIGVRAVGAQLESDAVAVRLANDVTIRAERVVVATNPRRQVLPQWLEQVPPEHVHPNGRLGENLSGRRILIVGGGLSAAHLTFGAAAGGADVALLARRPFVERRMDVHPTWLGPIRMGAFDAADFATRHELADEARGGGSMPAWAAKQLRVMSREGAVRLYEDDQVDMVLDVDGQTIVRSRAGRALPIDEVWPAFGGLSDIRVDGVLGDIADQSPLPLHGGLPALSADLRWGSVPVWVAGAVAALQIGPVAGNLFGHREAGRRIATALTGRDLPSHIPTLR
ncbi:FAD-dependent oxidoreductase [Euzebya tangerina]|uniref:FAD-dependent oxidoreductase n=1 Tax=Euzebya tangerina TaxID=591198 RepID=UPI0013C2C9D8|nr:FAD-dependent oxidoreductase [Euzebya tangerina]